MVPLNRPATVEGSVGKGAWCGRCWATDAGPQKESDTTESRKEERERKGHFRVILENLLRDYVSPDRQELTVVCSKWTELQNKSVKDNCKCQKESLKRAGRL